MDVPRREVENQENDNEPKVATTIRLYGKDHKKIQQHFPGRMSSLFRNFARDFLEVNGYNEENLLQQKQTLQDEARDIHGRIKTIDMQLNTILTEKYQQQDEIIDLEKQELFVAQMIYKLAQQHHLGEYKKQFLGRPYKPPTKTHNINFIKSRMKEYKGIPGFPTDPEKLLEDMEKIIAKSKDEWETQWDEEAITRKF